MAHGSGLDYFPLDVNMDEKIELIEAQFGIKGFGVVVKLFQRIYGGQGYYIEWTNDISLLFSRKIGLDCSLVSDIVTASINRGIFDRKLFDKYGILSSCGIQERYLKASSRRQKVKIKKEYLLVSDVQNYKNVDILAENDNILTKNDNIFKQSKRKESKVKESNYGDESPKRFYPPTIKEIHDYCAERKNRVDPVKFYDYYESNGWRVGRNKMKDWKAAVRTWERTQFKSFDQAKNEQKIITNGTQYDDIYK